MTAYVEPIVKNPLTMTERIFDSINLPLFACSRRAAYEAESGIPKGENRRTVRSLWYIFFDPDYFVSLREFNLRCKLNFIWRRIYFSFSRNSMRHVVSLLYGKEMFEINNTESLILLRLSFCFFKKKCLK